MTDRRLALLDAIRGVMPPPVPPPPDVLTYTQVCERLQISESTFYRLKRAGVFDRLEAGDIPHRISRPKFDAWMAGKPKGRVA